MDAKHPSHDREGVDQNDEREWPEGIPFAYHITFSSYGSKLYGDESGSVNRTHNIPGTPALPPNPKRVNAVRKQMQYPPYDMDELRRNCVLNCVKEVCAYRKWYLMAAHVRTYHVHTVVQAMVKPEKVLNDFKAYASRDLNRLNIDPPGCKRWMRHGSTRYLWKPEDAEVIIHYVVYEQGEPIGVFIAEDFR